MTESEMIVLAQRGDETAFAGLFEQHRRRIYSRCLGMLGNPADAEDLTQEVFMKLHRVISSFRGESTFATWLYRVASNVVLEHLRSKNPDATSLDELEREPADPRPETSTAAIKDILKLLPAGHVREAVRLRMVEGYSVSETAVRLGVGKMAVIRRVYDARRLLRDRLAKR